MKRAIASALVAATLAPASAIADDGLSLTRLSGTRFPDRAYVLTLPRPMALDESRVVARENGERVRALDVVPARAAEAGRFAVVLAIDTSNSMRGPPIERAVGAARAFMAERSENHAVAIVAFNRSATVVLPFTTDAARIRAALAAEPRLAPGTHIYDGVDRALALLREARAAAGSIVVLSDGADTGSAVADSTVVADARREGVRIFSVGLRSPSYEAAPLAELARATGGRYSEVRSSQDLEHVYGTLAARFANEYLLTYRSDARPSSSVHVAVTIEGVEDVALAEYATPAAPVRGTPFRRSFVERFVLSSAGVVATVAASALFLAFAVAVLLRRRPRSIRARMAQFVSVGARDQEADAARAREVVLAQAEKSISRAAWWPRFVEELELAGIAIAPVQIVLWTMAATVATGWLLMAVLGHPFFAIIALSIPLLVRSLIRRKLQRTRDLFADQLPDNLQVIASALRAGHSLVGALAVLVDDCPEPSRSEFRRALADEQLGVSLDEALGVVARRMESRDLEQVALVAALQRDTGGNTAEVLDRVAETVRSRFELRRLVKTLTTQGRMSRWVVSLLPVGLLAIMAVINPSYMGPLFTHPAGRIMLFAAAAMVVAGSLVIKRIINIKV